MFNIISFNCSVSYVSLCNKYNLLILSTVKVWLQLIVSISDIDLVEFSKHREERMCSSLFSEKLIYKTNYNKDYK